MMGFPMEIGRVVHSRAGRDRGRALVVVALEGEDFVRVADGDLRKLDGPKRKKAKHLRGTPLVLTDIAGRIGQGKPVLDAEIRKALEEAGYRRDHRELACEEGEASGKGR